RSRSRTVRSRSRRGDQPDHCRRRLPIRPDRHRDREQPPLPDANTGRRISMRHLSRRTVLRGLGAAVALPFLDAMYPAFVAPVVKKSLGANRMAYLYVPNGIIMDDWTPAGSLGSTPLGELPRISKALAPFRNDVMMLSGLDCDAGQEHGDG